MTTPACDGQMVGVIIESRDHKLLMAKRAEQPFGIAPPTGHIDRHCTPERAAAVEVFHEFGIRVSLALTDIQEQHIAGKCFRRACPSVHKWWVFRAESMYGEIQINNTAVHSVCWYDRVELAVLAGRARHYVTQQLKKHPRAQNPALELNWLTLFAQLRYLRLN